MSLQRTKTSAGRLSEAELTRRVIPHLERRGYSVHLEVGAVSRSIDAVLVDSCGAITALEFKISDWRQALKQARDHQILCERTAICMPRRLPTDALLAVLEESGIGYLGYDSESDEIEFSVPSRLSPVYWSTAGEVLKQRLVVEGGQPWKD